MVTQRTNDAEEVLTRAQDLLSRVQLDVMLNGANRLVTACPGAGKTRSIAARAALLATRGERLALTSYTNVGAQEIASSISSEFGYGLSEEHFVGTLHGLLLRFVFRNFGHLAMGCEEAPSLRTKRSAERLAVGDWLLNPDDFLFTPTGRFVFRGRQPERYVGKEDVARAAHDVVMAAKLAEAASGTCSTDDALYWSLEVLQRFDEVVEALAHRFTELIIDEAQDTSAIQLACLRVLIDHEDAPRVFLVGDFDQSIYSFQGASPEGCIGLAEHAGLDKFRLNENYRSSQLICNVAVHLRETREPDVARGPNKDFALPPQVFVYDPDAVAELPNAFEDDVVGHGLAGAESAVLARSNGLVAELLGTTSRRLAASGTIQALLEVTINRMSSLELSRIRQIEDAILDAAEMQRDDENRAPSDPIALRGSAMQVIEGLPGDVSSLGEWLDAANGLIASVAQALNPGRTDPTAFLKWDSEQDLAAPLSRFLPKLRNGRIQVGTIHSVKGKSLQGVMLVADHEESYRGSEADNWGDFFAASVDGQNRHWGSEELRVLYVGVTRASHLLRIAVPAGTSDRTLRNFQSAGFVVI